MESIALTRKMFTFMGTQTSGEKDIKEYLIHEIKSLEGYKDYHCFKGQPLFSVSELEAMSIIELFEGYSAIKLIPNAIELLYEIILYGDLDELSKLIKPDFNDAESITLFISSLRKIKCRKNGKNVTNITKMYALSFFDEKTITSLDDIQLSDPNKLEEFSDSSVRKIINTKGLYCIGEDQYNMYVQRSQNGFIAQVNHQNRIKQRIYKSICICIAIFITYKVCYQYNRRILGSDIGYFSYLVIYPSLFMASISLLLDFELGEGELIGALAGLILAITSFVSFGIDSDWHIMVCIISFISITILISIDIGIAHFIYLIATTTLGTVFRPIGRRLGILPYDQPSRNINNSNKNNSFY